MKNRLKEVRTAKGMSQYELAEKSNVSRAVIWGIETGRKTVIKTDTIERLAETLKEPVHKIFFLP